MITLTNGQASVFNSPVISALFNDTDRQFPIKDAFRLSDLVQQIQEKLKTYNDQVRKAIEGCGGSIKPNGQVTYTDSGMQLKAQNLINQLNEVEIEINGSKLKMKDEWPNLSLAEATILKALIEDG